MYIYPQSNDLFWPQWGEGMHTYNKRVLMPELCMVYFRVNVIRGRQAARKTTLYGQNCIPLTSLLPGIGVEGGGREEGESNKGTLIL